MYEPAHMVKLLPTFVVWRFPMQLDLGHSDVPQGSPRSCVCESTSLGAYVNRYRRERTMVKVVI